MVTFFSGVPHPPEHLLSQNVHILMDRGSGKTFNSAFVELSITPHQAEIVASARNLKVLKGRIVTVKLSNQDELMRSVFPKWVGQFVHGEPFIPEEQMESHIDSSSDPSMSVNVLSGPMSAECTESAADERHHHNLSSSSSRESISTAYGLASAAPTAANTPPFVTREEINALLLVCRNYKLHFSRKCAERPFENILSIMAKYPWHKPYRVLPLHRDHIFELLKLSIESLRLHLSKEYNTIHPTLLNRMVRSAILTPAFTERQKAMVLHVAGHLCPEDIIGWMTPQASTDVEADSVVQNASADKKTESETDIEQQVENLDFSGDLTTTISAGSELWLTRGGQLAMAQEPIDASKNNQSATAVTPLLVGKQHGMVNVVIAVEQRSPEESSNGPHRQPNIPATTPDIYTLQENSRFWNAGLPKLKASMMRSKSSLSSASSYASSSDSSLPSTPTHESLPPLSPMLSSATVPTTAAPESGEKTKNDTIVDAIKVITQSTPRLAKPCTVNQMGASLVSRANSAMVFRQ
ncbi:hypothetical protein BC939DRAFT_103074 [Gamsiella multidivaricata]|uniref:uncharacterized protein n=1 Tax=Gamsiella multidivaricata TaxID=101098 RepID=UPI00221E6D87|nr:uncharacterized protein BC939DRAFT_103074 [Gamsiella multidivaricata]KAI7832407.1 hypothetical protein BC939DRAFT_103074 [Gamsiella multidivaricata]